MGFVMKTAFLAALFLAAALFSGCSSIDPSAGKLEISAPYHALTAAQLSSIAATGLEGTNEAETAGNILAWQGQKMKYATPDIKADVSYPMRWNFIMPGIYPVSEMILERTLEEAGTQKIYGVCWDFAAVFASVAESYGLTVRIAAWKEYLSGTPGGDRGLSPSEYNTLSIKLTARNLNFSYDTIFPKIRETYKHFRAEVYLNGAWVAFDGTYPTGSYADDSNYEAFQWDEAYDSSLAYKK